MGDSQTTPNDAVSLGLEESAFLVKIEGFLSSLPNVEVFNRGNLSVNHYARQLHQLFYDAGFTSWKNLVDGLLIVPEGSNRPDVTRTVALFREIFGDSVCMNSAQKIFFVRALIDATYG
jgi:hypothetical protein